MWLNVLFHFPTLGLSVSPSIRALKLTTTWKACLWGATSLPNPLDAYWMQLLHVSTSCPSHIQIEALCTGAFGHWLLTVKCGVHGAMKALFWFYLQGCAAGALARRCCCCVTIVWGSLTCHFRKLSFQYLLWLQQWYYRVVGCEE